MCTESYKYLVWENTKSLTNQSVKKENSCQAIVLLSINFHQTWKEAFHKNVKVNHLSELRQHTCKQAVNLVMMIIMIIMMINMMIITMGCKFSTLTTPHRVNDMTECICIIEQSRIQKIKWWFTHCFPLVMKTHTIFVQKLCNSAVTLLSKKYQATFASTPAAATNNSTITTNTTTITAAAPQHPHPQRHCLLTCHSAPWSVLWGLSVAHPCK